MAVTPPIDADDFKARFARDFPFGDDPATQVTDGDIDAAISDATLIFNPEMWDGDVETQTAYLMLTAHLLALNIQASGGLGQANGVQNAGGMPISAQSVGSVSLTFELPESLKNNPTVAPFMRTTYGIRYIQMAWPRMRGNFQVVAGWNDTGVPEIRV